MQCNAGAIGHVTCNNVWALQSSTEPQHRTEVVRTEPSAPPMAPGLSVIGSSQFCMFHIHCNPQLSQQKKTTSSSEHLRVATFPAKLRHGATSKVEPVIGATASIKPAQGSKFLRGTRGRCDVLHKARNQTTKRKQQGKRPQICHLNLYKTQNRSL